MSLASGTFVATDAPSRAVTRATRVWQARTMVSSRGWGCWVLVFGWLGCGPKPVTEVPAAEAPATETPAAETPVVKTETPAAEAPVVKTEAPVTEAPVAKTETPAIEVEPTMTVTLPKSKPVKPAHWAPAEPPDKLPKSEPGVAYRFSNSRQPHSGQIAKYFAGWMLGYKELGYKVVAEHHGRESWTASLVHPSGPRLMLWMTDTGENLESRVTTVTGPVAPPALPGPCVAVPEVEFQVVMNHERGASTYPFRTTFDIDLDGDGVLDARVPLAKDVSCPGDVREALYVMRGACGHRVGTVGPWQIATLLIERVSPPTTGLKDVHTSTGAVLDGKRTDIRRVFTFEGGTYREATVEAKDFPCPDCKSRTCSGPQPIP